MTIRRAQPGESELVAQVLVAAAENLARRGEALWALSDVSPAAIDGHVNARMYFIASDADGPVAVYRFQLEDPGYWPEIAEGSSAYVHKLAVHPRAQGRGLAHALLRHAGEQARQLGRRHLRLDCVSGRPKLRAVYERFGFRLHSQRQLGQSWVDRFELELEPEL